MQLPRVALNLCHRERGLDLLPHLFEIGRAEGVAVLRRTPKRQLARKIAGMQRDVSGYIGIVHEQRKTLFA
jgi:hypothetical protein